MQRPIFVVSDSTGDTATSLVRAALAQFFDFELDIRTFGHTTERVALDAAVRAAAKEGALLAFTLVKAEDREYLQGQCEARDVPSIDLIGPLLRQLSVHMGGARIRGVPGMKSALSDDYFRRIEAVEFTVKHDDGAEPRHLHKADIVLVGVSRTSKTPLSTYLAQKGFKVANIPLVLGIDPPPQLFEGDQDRIFALTIEPEVLHDIRMSRIRNLGLSASSNYGSIDHIYMELEFADELFRRNPHWPVIDVSRRAIEETAAVILRVVAERAQEPSRATTVRG